MVELASPIILSNQAEEERLYILVVTASMRRLNLEVTQVILRDTVTASAKGAAFWNPQTAAVFSGPIRGGVIGNQGAMVEKLARKDAE